MPGAREAFAQFTLPSFPSKLYIMGGLGFASSGASYGVLNDLWEYDVLSSTWRFLIGTNVSSVGM